jgi:ElaB/YqjD/DUF883 family membrane-anchored ribosome-binding protein
MSQTVSHLGEQLSDAFEQVGALGRTAGKKLDEARRNTADALTGSASSVRDAGEAIDELAEKAAAKLDSTAKYVRSHDAEGILTDVRHVIRRHPASVVTGAAAVGFLFGLAIRKQWISLG